MNTLLMLKSLYLITVVRLFKRPFKQSDIRVKREGAPFTALLYLVMYLRPLLLCQDCDGAVLVQLLGAEGQHYFSCTFCEDSATFYALNPEGKAETKGAKECMARSLIHQGIADVVIRLSLMQSFCRRSMSILDFKRAVHCGKQ